MVRRKGDKGATFHRWTEEQKTYLREIAKGRYKKEIKEMINKRFNINLTEGQIKGAIARLGINTGLTGYFEAGSTPWNKGTKGLCKSNETSFKKGQRPVNCRPVGSERINVDGYTEVKVKEPNVWKLKHRVEFEKVFGEIPKGYSLVFADKNKLNFAIDNLILVSKKEILYMNNKKLIFEDKDLTKTGSLIAKLTIKTKERINE